MAIESEIATRRKERRERTRLLLLLLLLFASLFGARFFLSPPHLSTLHLRNYTRGVNRGFYTDSSASIPCTRNIDFFHRDILYFFQRLPASLLGRYNMTDRSRTSRWTIFFLLAHAGDLFRGFSREKDRNERNGWSESIQTWNCRHGERIPSGNIARKKRFERVKVPALHEFLALGVWIGGPRLVSRSLVPPPPPPPNGVDPRVRWIAWPAQLAAPKTLGCATRSLRLLGAPCVRACVFFLPSRPAGESVDGHQRAAPLSSILKSPPRYESCARRPPSVGSSISDRAPAKVIYTTRLTRDKYVDLEGWDELFPCTASPCERVFNYRPMLLPSAPRGRSMIAWYLCSPVAGGGRGGEGRRILWIFYNIGRILCCQSWRVTCARRWVFCKVVT